MSQYSKAVSTIPPLELDMERVTLSENGVVDYAWPHPIGHFKPFRDALTERLVTLARNARENAAAGSDGFAILLHYVLLELLSQYYCISVVNGFAALGRTIHAPRRSRTLSAVASGTAPPPPTIVGILRRGPQKPSAWRLPLRIARDFIVTDYIKRRCLIGPDSARDIIAASVYPLMEAHARSIEQRVIFRRPHTWFDTAVAPEREHAVEPLAERTIEIAKDMMERYGAVAPSWFGPALRAWLGPAIVMTEAWLHGIYRNRGQLPRRLWVGSGGDIWTRILRHAVRENGGLVTAHDHGSGTGQFVGEMHDNIIEFDFCDKFVTFTSEQADGLRQHHVDSRFLMRGNAPELVGIQTGVMTSTRSTPVRVNRRCRTAMLVSSWYFTDRVTYQAFISDIAYLDFEARLLAHLRDWGYDIIYKPHPLIVTRPPADFAQYFNGREETRPSEEVIGDADVLILPDPTSTAFATSLASSVPAVFVDFGLFKHSLKARAALKKRCAIVDAHCDPDQRVSIDWKALRHALDAAPAVTSNEYYQLFHANVL